MNSPRTLYDKIWDSHVVHTDKQTGESLLYIDLHLIHEVTTPQAFAGLKANGRKVRRPDLTLAVADHNTPTEGQANNVNFGFGVGPVALGLGFDYLVGTNLTLGGRLGFAIGGATASDASFSTVTVATASSL